MKKMLTCSLLVIALCLSRPALAPAGDVGQILSASWAHQLHLRPAIAFPGQEAFTRVQDKDHQCAPYQHWDKDKGQCVDNPNVTHHHGHYDPQPGERCWVECLCREGQ